MKKSQLKEQLRCISVDKETEQLRDYALKAINAIYRKDRWVRELYQAAGFDLHKASILLDRILSNEFFNLATEEGLAIYEKDLGITKEGSIQERRERVESLWKATGKATLLKIANIVDQYVRNEHEITYSDQEIHVIFHDDSYVWAIKAIRESIDIIKPAHIPLIIEDIREFNSNYYIGGYARLQNNINVEAYVGFSSVDVTNNEYGTGVVSMPLDIKVGG